MKLNEIAQSPRAMHGFFQRARGPNDTPGVHLHYIQGHDEWNEHLRTQATAKGDQRWLDRIEQMAARETQPFFHPTLGWWDSEDAYHSGKRGFGGATKQDIMRKNPDLQIHNSRADAVTAAGYA